MTFTIVTATALLAAIAASHVGNAAKGAGSVPSAIIAGQEYEIRHSYETTEQTSDGNSNGSSSGHTTLAERVLAVRADGIELEYDLPDGATTEERGPEWRLPARVLKRANGQLHLLNGAELEARRDDWLKKAKLSTSACGSWYFTWNAFRVECDPQSIIATIEGYDLGPPLREGAPYQLAGARGTGTIIKKASGRGNASFHVLLEVNPESVQRANAESDVVVGQMMKKPVTLEAALRERAKESVSGTIAITFDTDCAGNPWRQRRVTKLVTKRADGVTETKTSTAVLEKRLVSRVAKRR
jgi:hypothetical protein